MFKVITCERELLDQTCEMLSVVYEEDVIAITKKGVYRDNIFDIIKLSDEIEE